MLQYGLIPPYKRSSSDFRGNLIAVRNLDTVKRDYPTEDIGEIIKMTTLLVQNELRDQDIRSFGAYAPKIRIPLHPSDSTKALADSIRSNVLLNTSDISENSELNNLGLYRDQLLHLLGQFCPESYDTMIVIVGLEWIKQLRRVGLQIPGISHSSTNSELETEIPPGSVWFLSRGNY